MYTTVWPILLALAGGGFAIVLPLYLCRRFFGLGWWAIVLAGLLATHSAATLARIFAWPLYGFMGGAGIALIGIAFLMRWLMPGPVRISTERLQFLHWHPVVPLAIVAAPLLTIVYSVAVTPAAGWDALTYHLEFPAQWQAHNGIVRTQAAFGDLSPPYYPALAEHVLLLVHFSGDIAVARLFHAFWPGFAGLSIVAILRETDHKSSYDERVVFALLCVSFPAVSTTIVTADTDVALAALLLGAQAAFLRFLRNGSKLSVVACVLCLALAAATKYVGLVYMAGLMVVHLVLIAGKRKQLKRYVMAMPLLMIGSVTYIINWLETGNPLYPGELRLFGFEVFPGWYPAEFRATHPFAEFSPLSFFRHPGVLPGLLAFLIGLPFARHTRSAMMLKVAVIVAPIVLVVLYILVVPIHAHRLALAGWWMLLLPGWFAWRRLPGKWQAILAIVIGLTFWVMIATRLVEFLGDLRTPSFHRNEFTLDTFRVIYQEGANVAFYLAVTLVFAFFLFLFLREWSRTDYLRGWARHIRAAVAIVLVTGTIGVLLWQQSPRFYSESEEPLARAWACVIESPRAEAVGVIGSNAPFAMRYPDLSRPVHLLRNAEIAEGPLHDRSARLERDDSGTWQEIGAYPFLEVFRRNLERLDIKTVLVTKTEPSGRTIWSPEREWLAASEIAGWQRVFADTGVEIYSRSDYFCGR